MEQVRKEITGWNRKGIHGENVVLAQFHGALCAQCRILGLS